MPSSSTLLTLATAVSAVNAAYQGFNYGSTFTTGQAKAQTDFEAEFKTAAGLDGTNGAFNSARLYTMIQAGTPNTPISAIPAAISTKTSLLFGLWASAGDAQFANEIAALKSTISQYCGHGLDGLVAGISVGSEDLYRITPTGVASNAGPGAQPGTLVNYISEVRDTIKGSCLAKVPIGHVDTWNAWVLDSNKPVINAVDWLGMDTYPYYENTNSNAINNAKALYESALEKIQNAGPGKEVWVTETGWPVDGKSSGDAVASVSNAQKYWQQVGCPNFGKTNVWWYTLQDAEPGQPNPSFGLIGSTLTEKPLFDLSCANVDTNPTNPTSSSAPSKPASSSAAASSSAGSSSSSSGSGSGSGSSSSSSSSGSSSGSASGSGSDSTSTSEPQSTGSESQTTTASEPQTTGSSGSQTTGSEPQSTGSSGSQTTGSESQTTGGAGGAGGVPPASSTFTSVPFPTANTTSASGGSPTGSGSSSSPSASSTAPGSSGNKLSSFGAAAAAVAMAAIAL